MLSFLITNSNISLQIISTLSHISSIPRPEEKKNQKTKKREKLSDESIRTRLLHPRNAISPNAISLSSKKVNSSSFSRTVCIITPSHSAPFSMESLEPRSVRAEPGPRTQLPRPFSRRVHATARATASLLPHIAVWPHAIEADQMDI